MPGSLRDSQSLAAGASQPRTICPSLLAWASWVVAQSGQTPAVHHRLLLQHLDRISHGAIDRLLILMPPGSAKTTYASVNSDFWGAYVPTPPSAGTWYAWVEGLDGSTPTPSLAGFTVT
jgi:hypothetical protein